MTDSADSDEMTADTGRIPADLLGTALLVLLTNVAVFAPLVRETPLRIVVGLPVLLFLPGYALIAALFPEAAAERTTKGRTWRSLFDPGPSIDLSERIVLSFGVNLIVVPLLGYLLSFTRFGIRPGPVLLLVSAFTLVTVTVAWVRRRSLPPQERFSLPARTWLDSLSREVTTTDTTRRRVNMLVVAGLLISAAGLGYTLTTTEDDRFTEFYLVTETEDGDYVASGYPHNFTAGESQSVTVAVANHGDSSQAYTVVVLLQRVTVNGDDVRIKAEQEEMRYTTRVAPEKVAYQSVSIAPSMTGDDLRLTYLLYVGEPPATPSSETARHTLALWITVTDPDENRSTRLSAARVKHTRTRSLVTVPRESATAWRPTPLYAPSRPHQGDPPTRHP